MKISVKAHPKAKKVQILKKSDAEYEIWVREAPDKNRANEAIVEALAEYLGVAKSTLLVVRGHRAKNKVISVARAR